MIIEVNMCQNVWENICIISTLKVKKLQAKYEYVKHLNMILREVLDLHNQTYVYAIEDDEGVFCSAGSIQTDFQLLCGVGQGVATNI